MSPLHQFDDRFRRAIILPYVISSLLVLLSVVIDWGNGWPRGAITIIALLGLASAVGVWCIPWHRYHRDWILVTALSASILIAVLVYLTGGPHSPFESFFLLSLVFNALYHTRRVALCVAAYVWLWGCAPLLYATVPPTFVMRQVVVGCIYMLIVWVQNRMLAEVVHREQARHDLQTHLTDLQAVRDRLVEQATTDALTGVLNHRALMAEIDDHLHTARRGAQPLAVLFFDIDHFKQVNDTYGHHVGDQVIRQVAQVAQTIMRAEDILGRYGGEEFVAVLPGMALPEAAQVGERLRHGIAEHAMQLVDGSTTRVTVSVGVAIGEAATATRSAVLESADGALYQAKRAGRNQVCVHDGAPSLTDHMTDMAFDPH